MDLFRTIADGLLMAACFNALAAVMVLINPRYFLDSYPASIQDAAPEPMSTWEKRANTVFTVLVMGPLLVYGALSAWHAGTVGLWELFAAGYISWIIVNLDDLVSLDLILPQRERDRITIPGTEGHPDYQLGNWIRTLGLKEHLLLWLLVLVPFRALVQGGLVQLMLLAA